MARTCAKVLLAALCVQGGAGDAEQPTDAVLNEALAQGDECQGGEETCALSALQLRGAALTAQPEDSENPESAAKLADGEAAVLLESNASVWAHYGLHTPSHVEQYNGIAFPPMSVLDNGAGETHVFAIGDWGAITPGHFTAPNKRPSVGGRQCPQDCGYVYGVDDKAQLLVAAQVRARAATSNPQYVLNVGDNFYWAGIRQDCGSMRTTGVGMSMFSAAWQSVYGSLTSKPWLSCLGNHDYGGWQFNAGWDQQIGYTFANANWVMPARYYSRVMSHPGFSVEYFVIDSNNFDAGPPEHDGEHNICGAAHNPPGATCGSVGGPKSIADCESWFWSSYRAQQKWLEGKLAASTATWQVVITHFPCGHDSGWYKHLHTLGLDLLVTGHRHQQEIWANSGALGGLTCFVTGGGGGVTSEASPQGASSNQYGFFDLTFSADKIVIESINFNGLLIGTSTVTRSGGPAAAASAAGKAAPAATPAATPAKAAPAATPAATPAAPKAAAAAAPAAPAGTK